MTSYTVSFKETGLTTGTSWDVIFNNLNQTSTTAYDNFTYQINGTYAYTVSSKNYTASLASGTLTVNGKPAYENVTFTPQKTYSYLFAPSGLTVNSTYTVTMVSASRVYASPLTKEQQDANVTGLINGTYTLSVTASPPPGIARKYSAVIWNGSPSTLAVAGKQSTPQALTFERDYQVAVTESGLPSGTSWSLTFNSVVQTSASSTMYLNALNGSFGYSVGAVSGFLPNPGSGTLTVAGENATLGVAFSQSGITYSITFTEHGLPASTSWSLMLGQFAGTSTSTTMAIKVVNGTYSWHNITNGNTHYYAAYPNATGTLTVAGKAVSENITFRYGYTITFVPKDLKAFVPWSVTYNGSANTSKTSDNITFMIQNGSGYGFTVGLPGNWKSSPATGYVNVSGAAETFKLNMTSLTFPVTFKSNLPAGVLFSVVVNGTTYSSANGTIILHVHNGTMTYTVASVSGYDVTPESGTITESFAPITISISYTTTGGGSGGLGGLSFSNHYVLWGAAAAVIVIVTVAFALIAGDRKKVDRLEKRVSRIGKKKRKSK
jgi:hypothetical protein